MHGGMSGMLTIDWCLVVICAWLRSAWPGLLALRDAAASSAACSFRPAAPSALLLAASPWPRWATPPQVAVLPIGLPDLPFHLRLDALSASS